MLIIDSNNRPVKGRSSMSWRHHLLRFVPGMMTSSNGNIFRVTGPLCGEFTGDRWIPRTKASGAERYWPYARGIHRWRVNSPHKGQWRGALMFSLICAWINGWVSNREAGDLRRHRAHYDAIIRSTCTVTSRVLEHIPVHIATSCRLKSPATRLFVDPFVQANIRGTINALIALSLCEGNPPVTGGFP